MILNTVVLAVEVGTGTKTFTELYLSAEPVNFYSVDDAVTIYSMVGEVVVTTSEVRTLQMYIPTIPTGIAGYEVNGYDD